MGGREEEDCFLGAMVDSFFAISRYIKYYNIYFINYYIIVENNLIILYIFYLVSLYMVVLECKIFEISPVV